jgi:hypothetical protein
MGKITVDNGGELKPTQGLTYPRLEVAFDARIMQYKILRYRDDRPGQYTLRQRGSSQQREDPAP